MVPPLPPTLASELCLSREKGRPPKSGQLSVAPVGRRSCNSALWGRLAHAGRQVRPIIKWWRHFYTCSLAVAAPLWILLLWAGTIVALFTRREISEPFKQEAATFYVTAPAAMVDAAATTDNQSHISCRRKRGVDRTEQQVLAWVVSGSSLTFAGPTCRDDLVCARAQLEPPRVHRTPPNR